MTRNADPTRQTLSVEASELARIDFEGSIDELFAGDIRKTLPADAVSQALLMAERDRVLAEICQGKF